MPAKNSSKGSRGRGVPRADHMLCGVDIYRGDDTVDSALSSADMPKDIRKAQEKARYHYENNGMVGCLVDGRINFFNYGQKWKVDGKEPKGKDKDTIEESGEKLEKYIGTVWKDSLVYDTVVSFYRKGGSYGAPFTIQPSKCKYTNAMGNEILKVELKVDKAQLEARFRDRYSQPEITLGENGEVYKVLTNGEMGTGFGRPALQRVFRTLSQAESMEAGEALMAFYMRTPIRQHKLGHETRYGPGSGTAQNFWDKKRGDALLKFMKKKVGMTEMTTNFDHSIGFVWPDQKLFTEEKWGTIYRRLMWWGGSFAFMYLNKSINPYLFPMLEMEARERRRVLRWHINTMARASTGIKNLEVVWGDQCFTDQRLGFEMMKFLIQQGPLSLTTGLRKAGYDAIEEGELKRTEADGDAALMMPLFDAAHGDKPGRKKGTPDPRS